MTAAGKSGKVRSGGDSDSGGTVSGVESTAATVAGQTGVESTAVEETVAGQSCVEAGDSCGTDGDGGGSCSLDGSGSGSCGGDSAGQTGVEARRKRRFRPLTVFRGRKTETPKHRNTGSCTGSKQKHRNTGSCPRGVETQKHINKESGPPLTPDDTHARARTHTTVGTSTSVTPLHPTLAPLRTPTPPA